MNKTRIEWANFTLNPIKGKCPVDCKDNSGKSYCYARRMYDRFKWDETVRCLPFSWLSSDLASIKKPSRIFWGSTFELFHPSIDKWRLHDDIFRLVREFPQHTHIFLTKQPQNLPHVWPDNCWVGVSATNTVRFLDAHEWLHKLQAKIKFISVEPFLDWDSSIYQSVKYAISDRHVDWIIIGQCTPVRPATMPKIEWIRDLVQAADEAGVPVFLKDNLKSLLKRPEGWTDALFVSARSSAGIEYLRQEFPNPEGEK